MTEGDIETSAIALDRAWRDGVRLDRLPSAPEDIGAALAVQARVVALSGEAVAGWKVAAGPNGELMWGAIYSRDLHDSPARVPADRYPVRGVEAEIAYRFRIDLPRGDEAMSAARIAELVEPVPVFEIVDSRFRDYAGTPVVHRLCDRMSNGGLVVGRWTGPLPRDLAAMRVRLEQDGGVIYDGAGGHVRGHPFGPAVDFIAARHGRQDFAAGQIVTTGTFSGLVFGAPGQTWRASFGGAAEVALSFA